MFTKDHLSPDTLNVSTVSHFFLPCYRLDVPSRQLPLHKERKRKRKEVLLLLAHSLTPLLEERKEDKKKGKEEGREEITIITIIVIKFFGIIFVKRPLNPQKDTEGDLPKFLKI